jgi:hypothetical protein
VRCNASKGNGVGKITSGILSDNEEKQLVVMLMIRTESFRSRASASFCSLRERDSEPLMPTHRRKHTGYQSEIQKIAQKKATRKRQDSCEAADMTGIATAAGAHLHCCQTTLQCRSVRHGDWQQRVPTRWAPYPFLGKMCKM